MEAYDAKSLLVYGTDHYGTFMPTHMKAWGGAQQSPLLDYLMVPFIKLFGLNKVSVRIPMLLLSIIGLIFLWLLVREAFGIVPGLVALALCSINPWHLVQSRYALDCNVFPHVLVIGLYMVIRGIKRKKNFFMYWGIVFLALSHYGYAISAYMIPILLVILAVYLLKNKIVTPRQIIFSVILYLIVAGQFIATMVLNAIGIKSDIITPCFTIPAFPQTGRKSDMIFWSDNIPAQLLKNAKELFKIIFLQHEYVPWDSVEHYGTIFICMVPIAVIGFAFLFKTFIDVKDKRIRAVFMVIVSWLIMSVIGGLITNVDGILRRFNVFYYLEIIFVALGMYCIYLYGHKLFRLTLCIASLMGALLFYSYNTSYAAEFTSSSSISVNVMQAIHKMKDLDCNKNYITPTTLISDCADVSEIWVLYGFDIDSHYYRGISNDSYAKEYSAPYKDTFIYEDPCDIQDIDSKEDTAYLINERDKSYFDDSFSCYEYGCFCVEVPEWKVQQDFLFFA